eukprot:Ihof_evm11s13 gene=Ihof_evmTU11s13
MSYCREEGKDKIFFLTQEDQHDLLKEDGVLDLDTEGGLDGAVNEEGEIDWDCPCLKGMAHGPCGPEFRNAFTCFIDSDAEPKGLDCVELFDAMQKCITEHPEEYVKDGDVK